MKKKESTTTSFRINHIKKELNAAAKKEKMKLHEFVVKVLEAHINYNRNKFLQS